MGGGGGRGFGASGSCRTRCGRARPSLVPRGILLCSGSGVIGAAYHCHHRWFISFFVCGEGVGLPGGGGFESTLRPVFRMWRATALPRTQPSRFLFSSQRVVCAIKLKPHTLHIIHDNSMHAPAVCGSVESRCGCFLTATSHHGPPSSGPYFFTPTQTPTTSSSHSLSLPMSHFIDAPSGAAQGCVSRGRVAPAVCARPVRCRHPAPVPAGARQHLLHAVRAHVRRAVGNEVGSQRRACM